MRRAHGYDGVSWSQQRHRTEAVEEENEYLVDGLQNKIHALKSLSIDIGSEVRTQNKLLNEMDDDFDSSKGILSSTMSKLLRVSKAGYSRHILYLLLFSFIVFFVLYLYLKFR
ncbi:BET1 (predicted) [Pycnogonum litorale]